MAAIPHELNHGRRSSSSSRKGPLSHGRGGLGNMGHNAQDDAPLDLETPTLKGDHYTTGRGGSGNMAKNDDPHAARRAQDVVAPPHRESISDTHVGRGGAANVFRPTAAEIEAAKRDNANLESAIAEELSEKKEQLQASKGLADKGKEWLNHLISSKK